MLSIRQAESLTNRPINVIDECYTPAGQNFQIKVDSWRMRGDMIQIAGFPLASAEGQSAYLTNRADV